MSTPRPWPPPPRGAATLGRRERLFCDWLEVLALLHVLGGLLWPIVIVGTHALDARLPLAGAGRFWCALIGPTIASWGLLFWFVAHHGLRRGLRWPCDALIAAIAAWMPLDFSLCFAFRFWPGALIDPAFGLIMLGLLLAMRRKLAP
jgi:hypothetical protein